MKQFGSKDLDPIETLVRWNFPICSYSITYGDRREYRIELTEFGENLTEEEAWALIRELQFHIERIRKARTTIHPDDIKI